MRTNLPENTYIKINDNYYKIIGPPIGEGGGSIIYPAVRLIYNGHKFVQGNLLFAIKEAFPLSENHLFIRNADDEIVSENDADPEASAYLRAVQQMQLQESLITANIYETGFRLIPILDAVNTASVSHDQGISFHTVNNTYTVMESLAKKGKSLTSYLEEYGKFSLIQTLRTTEQILLALQEVHNAGYLHLDIQAGNILLKGSLDDTSDLATIIDFGSARPRMEDGKTTPITNQMIFCTKGYSAPEIYLHNDGTLRLGPEADFYSIGYLMLYLLNGKKQKHATNIYLPKRKLQSFRCPKHLYPTLQDIFQKALAESPDSRYHSAREMLLDIRNLLSALQPYRGDLADVEYDAFICYKHNPADKAIARALQTWLEHFHVPKSISESSPTAKKKINRVFLDQGELSSGNMNVSIKEALKKSGHLIVLCSKETKNSYWVNLEIDTFLQYHDKSRILAIFTDGDEPSEIFPTQLLNHSKEGNDEVLAADIRSSTRHQSLKKLQRDALLRIAAPIIGTTYDSLKQRRKLYIAQRALAASSFVFLILLGFTSYIYWQSQEVERQYAQSQRNQARYLSKTALEAYESGDKEKSLLLSLGIQPDDPAEGPVVPEQMLSLSTALSCYTVPGSTYYSPAYTTDGSNMEFCEISPDGSYLLSLDQYGNACFINTSDGTQIWSFSAVDLDPHAHSDFRFGIPVSEDTALLFTSGDLFYVNITHKELLYHLEDREFLGGSKEYYSLADHYLATAVNSSLYVYDISTGELIHYVDFNENKNETHLEYEINNITFSPDHSKVYIGFSYSYYNRYYDKNDETKQKKYRKLSEQFFANNTGNGFVCYDLSSRTITRLSDNFARQAIPMDDNYISVMHYEEQSSDVYSIYSDTSGATNVQYWFSIYDLKTNTEIYASTPFTLMGAATGMKYDSQRNILYCWFNEKLYIYDINLQKLITELSFSSPIESVFASFEDTCYIGFYEGYTLRVQYDSEIARLRIAELSEEVLHFFYNPNTDSLIQRTANSIVFSNTVGNPSMLHLNTADIADASYRISSVEYYNTENSSFRCVNLYQTFSSSINGLALYAISSSESTEEAVFSYLTDTSSSCIYSVDIKEKENNIYLSFIEKISDTEVYFYKYNLSTGELLIEEDFSTYDTLDLERGITYGDDMQWMVIQRIPGGCVMFDISGSTATPEHRAILSTFSLSAIEISGDNDYLILLAETSTETCSVYLYNIQDGVCQAPVASYDDNFLIKMKAADTQPIFAVFNGTNILDIYNYSGNHLHEFHLITDNSAYFDYAFFDDSQYLITTDVSNITMWNIEQEQVVMSYTKTEEMSGNLQTLPDSDYFLMNGGGYLENPLSDTGIILYPLTIFYVDEKHQFYPVAIIQNGTCDLSTMEICVNAFSDAISFCHYYNYKELKEMALKELSGRTLTDKERTEYFLTENP